MVGLSKLQVIVAQLLVVALLICAATCRRRGTRGTQTLHHCFEGHACTLDLCTYGVGEEATQHQLLARNCSEQSALPCQSFVQNSKRPIRRGPCAEKGGQICAASDVGWRALGCLKRGGIHHVCSERFTERLEVMRAGCLNA